MENVFRTYFAVPPRCNAHTMLILIYMSILAPRRKIFRMEEVTFICTGNCRPDPPLLQSDQQLQLILDCILDCVLGTPGFCSRQSTSCR